MNTHHPTPDTAIEIESQAVGRTTREVLKFIRRTDRHDVMVCVARPNTQGVIEAIAILVTAQQLREAAGAVLDGPDIP